ncbi:MAG: 5-formyltetrahydrofolate cyclo-ligase [Hyphomicrobiaceae bacterium]
MQQPPPASGEEAIIQAKRQLRDEAKGRRAAIPATFRQTAAAQVALIGLDFVPDLKPGAPISGFLPIGEELNPVPLMRKLADRGHPLGLPVMVGKGKPLVFRQWAPGDPLQTVIWGIREPQPTAPVLEPEVMIVPLLAFNRKGHRLGYGGGFYDRTISAQRQRHPVVTVGFAYAEQEVDAVPHLDYDETLDWILTPNGPIRCKD